MKKNDIQGKTQEELRAMLATAREELRRLYFDLKLGTLQDASAVEKAKRSVARILTVLQARYGEKA